MINSMESIKGSDRSVPIGSALSTESFAMNRHGLLAHDGETLTLTARVTLPAGDDSLWIQIDDGDFVAANGLQTSGWQRVKLTTLQPAPGTHSLTIKYRESGALLDRIGITTYPFGPKGL